MVLELQVTGPFFVTNCGTVPNLPVLLPTTGLIFLIKPLATKAASP